jgi:hypothetical protein
MECTFGTNSFRVLIVRTRSYLIVFWMPNFRRLRTFVAVVDAILGQFRNFPWHLHDRVSLGSLSTASPALHSLPLSWPYLPSHSLTSQPLVRFRGAYRRPAGNREPDPFSKLPMYREDMSMIFPAWYGASLLIKVYFHANPRHMPNDVSSLVGFT